MPAYPLFGISDDLLCVSIITEIQIFTACISSKYCYQTGSCHTVILPTKGGSHQTPHNTILSQFTYSF